MGSGGCTKRRFRSKDEAVHALHMIRSHGKGRGKTPFRTYECPSCRGWHLTSRS